MEVQVITNMKSLWDPFHGDKPRERLCVYVCGSVVPNSSFRLIVILCGNYLSPFEFNLNKKSWASKSKVKKENKQNYTFLRTLPFFRN